MKAIASQPLFTVMDQPLEKLPRCPGVYRLLNDREELLYIGKSVDIRSRVRSHLNDGSKTARQLQMARNVARVDCHPTAGEVGALLLENVLIKSLRPLYNRRQREIRRMWSHILEPGSGGYLQPRLASFSLGQLDIQATYGSYPNRHHAKTSLARLAQLARLCPRILNIERGRGPCFQYQIRRCAGACIGEESATSHNARLLDALESQRLTAWPITTPVLLHERTRQPHELAPPEEWHLLHNWAYLGTFRDPGAALQADPGATFMFDRDTYHILRNALGRSQASLLDASTLEAVSWPDRKGGQ